MGFPGGTRVKDLPANAGDTRDTGSIPGSGKSPGVGNGNPLQYSCLENTMDRGAWLATVHGDAKCQTRERLHFTLLHFGVIVESVQGNQAYLVWMGKSGSFLIEARIPERCSSFKMRPASS